MIDSRCNTFLGARNY